MAKLMPDIGRRSANYHGNVPNFLYLRYKIAFQRKSLFQHNSFGYWQILYKISIWKQIARAMWKGDILFLVISVCFPDFICSFNLIVEVTITRETGINSVIT